MLTPSASITSAEPHLELMLRLPCLATRTPAPAIVRAVAVEMLKVPLVSPPVPQVSTRASRSVPLRSSASPSSDCQRRGFLADGLREADDLLHRFALHVKRDQQRSDLRVGGFAVQDLRHHIAGLFAGEGSAMVGDLVQSVEDHGRMKHQSSRLKTKLCVRARLEPCLKGARSEIGLQRLWRGRRR